MFAPWKCEMAGPKEWMPAPLPLHSKHYVMKRLILLWAALVLAAVSLAQTSTWGLMQLPYATDALTPVITRRTVELHHGKHLAAYAATLQRLVEGTEYERKSLEYIVRHSTGVIFNNAGQVLNHNLYFEQFSPTGGGQPTGRLAQAIEAQWGSFENFCEEFEKRGTALFGSGGVWLAQNADSTLIILQEPGGGNPIASGRRPILGFDVWERAYYLDYENRRAEHLHSLWSIVDWQVVGERFR